MDEMESQIIVMEFPTSLGKDFKNSTTLGPLKFVLSFKFPQVVRSLFEDSFFSIKGMFNTAAF